MPGESAEGKTVSDRLKEGINVGSGTRIGIGGNFLGGSGGGIRIDRSFGSRVRITIGGGIGGAGRGRWGGMQITIKTN